MPSDDNKYQGMYCCTVPMDGVRMLTFPDGTKSGVFGLNEILAAVYLEGRGVTDDTAEEIVERLSAKSYIVPSARQKYVELLREEYGRYVETLAKTNPPAEVCEQNDLSRERKGLLSRFLKGKRTP